MAVALLVPFWTSIRGSRSRRVGVERFFPLAEVQTNLRPLLALLDPGEDMEEFELGAFAVLPVHLEHPDHLPARKQKEMSAEEETNRGDRVGVYLSLDVGAALRATLDLLDDPVPFAAGRLDDRPVVRHRFLAALHVK